MGELLRYAAHSVTVLAYILFKILALEQLFDVCWYFCLNHREIVEINPDVFGSALVNLEFFCALYPENQIVEITGAYFQFVKFHRALCYVVVGKGQAMRL